VRGDKQKIVYPTKVAHVFGAQKTNFVDERHTSDENAMIALAQLEKNVKRTE
jgi:hypothetical protein